VLYRTVTFEDKNHKGERGEGRDEKTKKKKKGKRNKEKIKEGRRELEWLDLGIAMYESGCSERLMYLANFRQENSRCFGIRPTGR